MLFHCRAHRPCAAGNGEDQPRHFHHGSQYDGVSRCAADGFRTLRGGAHDAQRRISPAAGRSSRDPRNQGVSATPRRSVSTGTVRPAGKKEVRATSRPYIMNFVKYDPETHHRRSIRLRGYDYAQWGAYFVTVVTQHRICFLAIFRTAKIFQTPLAESRMRLGSDYRAAFRLCRWIPLSSCPTTSTESLL